MANVMCSFILQLLLQNAPENNENQINGNKMYGTYYRRSVMRFVTGFVNAVGILTNVHTYLFISKTGNARMT
jgi:hypothetical protein